MSISTRIWAEVLLFQTCCKNPTRQPPTPYSTKPFIHPALYGFLPDLSLSFSLYTQLSFFLCVLILHFLWSFFFSNVACNLFCKTRPLVQLWWKGWGLLFITSAAFNQQKWRRSNRIFSTFFRQKKSSNIFFFEQYKLVHTQNTSILLDRMSGGLCTKIMIILSSFAFSFFSFSHLGYMLDFLPSLVYIVL